MTKKYDFSFIEKKWQTIWENEKTFDAKIDKSKKKYYVRIRAYKIDGKQLHYSAWSNVKIVK